MQPTPPSISTTIPATVSTTFPATIRAVRRQMWRRQPRRSSTTWQRSQQRRGAFDANAIHWREPNDSLLHNPPMPIFSTSQNLLPTRMCDSRVDSTSRIGTQMQHAPGRNRDTKTGSRAQITLSTNARTTSCATKQYTKQCTDHLTVWGNE